MDKASRYFRCGPFVVDTEAPLLITPSGETTLEPQVHDLLVFFCRNAGRVITRDEILTAIWRGGIVSDNAVSKLVARLRRTLGDDSGSPAYIQTVSRRGYRFAAEVTRTDSASTPDIDRGRYRALRWWMLALAAVALAAVTWFMVGPNDHGTNRGPMPVRPLTRHSGAEFAPALSPDGRFLAYTRLESPRSERELWLKDLRQDADFRLDVDGFIGNLLAWAPDSRRLAMLSRVNDACRVRALTLDEDGSVVGNAELVSCDGRAIGDLVFGPGGERLFYTSREQAFRPMQILVADMDNDLLYVAASGDELPLDNTAVYEDLPALSMRSDAYAFLSNRGGRSQAYVGRLREPGSRQITRFEDSRLVVSLALSPDGDRLALATYNELLVFDVATGTNVRQARTDSLILSMGWLGADRLAVSRLADYRPALFVYSVDAGEFTAAAPRWSGAVADYSGAEPVWYAVDQEGSVIRTGDAFDHPVATGLKLPRVFLLTGLNLKAANGRLQYQRDEHPRSTLVEHDPASGQSEPIGTWDFIAGFDVGPDGVILSHEVGRVGDVVATASGQGGGG